MCLGLTIPMTLFVGVEMTSGGRTTSKTKAAAALATGSLKSRWMPGAPASGRPLQKGIGAPSSEPGSRGLASPAVEAPPAGGRQTFAGARLVPMLESDPADGTPLGTSPGVVLGPQLELDPTVGDDQRSTGLRLPAIPTGARPRAELVPDDVSTAEQRPAARIEKQLDEILGHLDRLTSKISDQQAAADPMRQAAELLTRLQQARQIEELASRPSAAAPPENLPQPPPSADAGSITNPAEPSRVTDPSPPRIGTPFPVPSQPAPQTKIYRPRYISVRALETLATPLLTVGVGRIGAASNDTGHSTGDLQGQVPTQWDALVVRDVPEVLRKIDRLVRELDVPPERILIEATILTVRLVPSMPYGIDLGEYNSTGQPFSIFPADLSSPGAWGKSEKGAGSAPSIPTLSHGTGVKCGILRGDVRAFLQVLCAATQIRGSAASQTMIVNKQSTEFLIGDGFATASDGARPLTSGTILRVRPIVTRDGLIHLEFRSSSESDAMASAGVGLAREGALTNQLTLASGETAVLSGFIADHLVVHSYKKPMVGELPLVGSWFRGESGTLQRTETIVLITPHLAEHAAGPSRPVSSSAVPRVLSSSATAIGARPIPAEKPLADHTPPRTDTTAGDEAVVFSATSMSASTLPTPESTNDIGGSTTSVFPPGEIRQASAVAPPKVQIKKRVRKPTRQTPAKKTSRSGRSAGELDEIPELPVEVDEMGGPVIRPATGLRPAELKAAPR